MIEMNEDYLKYLQFKKEFIPTIHSLVIGVYWKTRKANWRLILRIAVSLLALQTLSNAMLLHSFWLAVLSVVFILIGTKLIK